MESARSAVNIFMQKTAENNLFSRISIFLSSICVIHCLSVPFIVLLIPTFAQFMSNTVEAVLVLSVVPLSAIGFLPTWRKHKNYSLLYKYLLSITALLTGQFVLHSSHSNLLNGGISDPQVLLMLAGEWILLLGGAIGLAYTIYKNNKHTHVCKNPHHHH